MWSSLNHKQSPHGGCVPLVSNPGLIPFIFFLSLLSGGFFGVDAFELIRSKEVVGNYNPTEGNSIFVELFRRKEMRTESMKEILQSNKTVILIVDFQWDFMRYGQIEHKHADTISYVGLVEEFVKLARKKGIPVAWSQDWHPKDHNAFYHASGKGKALYDIVEIVDQDKKKYNQTLVPPHCIQGSHGAEIAMETKNEIVVQKGLNKYFDSYSAFKDDRARDTGLNVEFKDKYDNIITFGIGDCVHYTAKDAKEKNYKSFTIKELSPGREDAYDWDKEYKEQGLGVWHLAEVKQIVQAMPDKKTIVNIEYKHATNITTPTKDILTSPKTVILVVDFQWDFMKGGKLELENADTTYYAGLVESFVNLARQKGIPVVWSQDWHPEKHVSFVTTHPGKKFGDKVEVNYGILSGSIYEQQLWPEHCIQGSHGAEIAMETKTEFVLQKGTDKEVDSYSAFKDKANIDTALVEHLKHKYQNVITFGLATDVCVLHTATDAKAKGFTSYTIIDLCRKTEGGDETYDWNTKFAKEDLRMWRLKAVENIVKAMPDKIPTPIEFTPPTKEILGSDKTVIVVVDFQWDFMKGGPVEIKGADTTYYAGLVEKFVELARKKGIPVVWSQDWHPEEHVSFVTNHSDKKPGDTVDVNHGKSSYKQKLWKEHCIQGSHGAKIAMETKNEIVVKKGTNKDVDSYSPFEDHGGKTTKLDTKLNAKNYKKVITFGLFRDGGVQATAAHAEKYHFESYTIKELSHGDNDATYDLNENYTNNGLKVWHLAEVEKILKEMPDRSNSETTFQAVPTGIGSFKLMNVGMVLAMVGAILLVVYVFGRDKLESIFFKCKQGGTSERDDQEDPDGLEGHHMVHSYEMTPLMHHAASDSHSNALGCSGGHAHVCSTP